MRLSGMILVAVLPPVLLFGCSGSSSGSDGGSDGGYPDPGFVYRAEQHAQVASDTPFLQERPTLFRTTDRLADLDVRALVVAGGRVWAGTASGLFELAGDGASFERRQLQAGQVSVRDIARRVRADGKLVVALEDAVELVDLGGGAGQMVAIPAAVTAVAVSSDAVWVGTEAGLYRLSSGTVEPVAAVTAAIRDLAVDAAGTVWLATAAGLVSWDGAQAGTFDSAAGKLADDDVRAVFGLESGVLAGTAAGAALVGTGSDRVLTAGVGSLPYDDVTSVWAEGDLLAFGHGIGATVVQADFQHVDHYHSLRWIPDERVTAVALEPDGTRWLATPAGISRIRLEQTTLEQKAVLFEAMNDKFWRLDFVSCEGRLEDPWQPDQPLTHWDHDNDGLWTEMQVGAWSYAAAASGDDTYCQQARRAMRGMMRLIDIPAVSFAAIGRERGFVARSFVRDDEAHLFSAKASDPQWVLVEDYAGEGHDYYWKSDTSSDETTGHFFGYPLFFDFCADAEERAVLADHAGALAATIVEHDFYLVDMDGEPTTWGHWAVDYLPVALDGLDKCLEDYDIERCYSSAYGGGWLNAIEILGHMLAAYHMTGNPEFYDAYLYLLDNRYAELVDFSEDVWTVTKKTVANHSDHELAMLAYHTLIRYEPDDARRQRWIDSLLGMYQWEIPERNPLWAAIVASFVSDGYRLDEALQTLREWPEDWREWRVDNSHRRDAVLDVPDRSGDPQFTTTLPYDEIRTLKWNTNPYQVSGGGDGREVQAPWPWLLPYWMMRYHGVIVAP